jgi:hypothetical protein
VPDLASPAQRDVHPTWSGAENAVVHQRPSVPKGRRTKHCLELFEVLDALRHEHYRGWVGV